MRQKYLCLIFTLTISGISFAQTFEWAKNFGWKGDVSASVISCTKNAVYVVGGFVDSVDIDPGPDTTYLASAGSVDAFLVKLDTAGIFLWGKHIGGVSPDGINYIMNDDSGNIIMAGVFGGTVDIDPGPGVFNVTASGTGTFILKLDSLGNFIWGGQLSSSNNISGTYVSLAPNGNIYMAGYCIGTTDVDPGPGTFTLTGPCIFIAEINSSGNLLWCKTIIAQSNLTLTTDNSGNIILWGTFINTVDFDPGPLTYNLNSGVEPGYFICKLNSSGNFIWAKAFITSASTGSNLAQVGRIRCDANNNLVCSGFFDNCTLDLNPGTGTSFITPIGTMGDGFICKIDSSGNYMWGGSIGYTAGNSWWFSPSIALDAAGNIYTTGLFSGTFDFDIGPATYNLTSNALDDIFICKLGPSGNCLWATSYGNSGSDIGLDVGVHNSDVYFSGIFSDTIDFDPGSGTFNVNPFTTSREGYLAKVSFCQFNHTQTVASCVNYISPYTGSVWTSSGIYTETINGASCDSIITTNLTITNVNTSISANQTSLYSGATSATYQWLDCNNGFSAIAGETGQYFYPASNGNYAAQVTQNGCVDTTVCIPITQIGVTENNFRTGYISLHPNPTNGIITLDIEHFKGQNAKIIITDVTAREILQQPIQKTSTEIELYEKGLVFLTLYINNEPVATQKVVVK